MHDKSDSGQNRSVAVCWEWGDPNDNTEDYRETENFLKGNSSYFYCGGDYMTGSIS